MTQKLNSKIKFEAATISCYVENSNLTKVATVFRVLVRIDGSLFYGKDQFETEEEIDQEIARLQKLFSPKSQKKVKLLEAPSND
jgi:hypothetical protein